MKNNITQQLDKIFKPKSLAVIGASKNLSKWGGRALLRAIQSDYMGAVYPINSSADEILGLKVYKDVCDVPGDIDLAVFAIPAALVPEAIKSCIKKGIKGGVMLSAGFSEIGPEGKALEDETVRIAQAGGLRFVGPNGMGTWTSAVGLNLALDEIPLPGSLAFISQSGTYGGALAEAAKDKNFGLSKFISIGNQADLTVPDYLEYLADDDDTQVIAVYVEGLKDGRRFIEIAGNVSRTKPIVLYKGGSTENGARATMSHTASIAGTDNIFDSMCRQAGVIRAYEISHLFCMCEALMTLPLPSGNRIAVVGSGGQGVVTVDALGALGLDVPELESKAQALLKDRLPSHAPTPKNPVDFAAGPRTAIDEAQVAEALASLDYIDGVITNAPHMRSTAPTVGQRIKDSITGTEILGSIPKKYGKPVITLSWRTPDVIRSVLQSSGIPIFGEPEECARAMYALVRYGEIRRRN